MGNGIGHQGPNCVLRKVGGVGNGMGRKKGKNNLGGGEKQLGCMGRGWVLGGTKGKTIRVTRGRGWVLGGRKEKSGSAGGRGWGGRKKGKIRVQGAGIGWV